MSINRQHRPRGVHVDDYLREVCLRSFLRESPNVRQQGDRGGGKQGRVPVEGGEERVELSHSEKRGRKIEG